MPHSLTAISQIYRNPEPLLYVSVNRHVLADNHRFKHRRRLSDEELAGRERLATKVAALKSQLDPKTTIGIGVTTHNRYDLFSKHFAQIKKYCGPNCHLVVVDDGSQKPVPEATFRFDRPHGVARAKNKCLELLDGCEHVFLFDDDISPLCDWWYTPYILSPEGHLGYNWGPYLKKTDDYIYYTDTHPIGVMLYFKKSTLDRVGGFDIGFGRYGAEHTELTNRIHLAGLTSEAFIDVNGSEFLFDSEDRYYLVYSSFSLNERARRMAFERGTRRMKRLLAEYKQNGVPHLPFRESEY